MPYEKRPRLRVWHDQRNHDKSPIEDHHLVWELSIEYARFLPTINPCFQIRFDVGLLDDCFFVQRSVVNSSLLPFLLQRVAAGRTSHKHRGFCDSVHEVLCFTLETIKTV